MFSNSGFVRIFATTGILAVTACTSCSPPPAPSSQMALKGSPSPEVFATPDQAVDALVKAIRSDRKDELLNIMGPDADQLIHSGDPVADEQSRERFLTAYDTAHEINNPDVNRAVLVVGEEQWPMPIPLINTRNGWWFDTAAGAEEILDRRIGKNELNVIEICRAYVEAQQDYAALQMTENGKREYAQRFRSSVDKHDGLYWPVADGEQESPLGSLIADATSEGYSEKAVGKQVPYHGYYFGILKKQGTHASGGAEDYVVHGHMVRGYALVAFPAKYGDSGVMTFIISQNGIVYEKNFGPDTAKIARHITRFDPDESWNIVR